MGNKFNAAPAFDSGSSEHPDPKIAKLKKEISDNEQQLADMQKNMATIKAKMEASKSGAQNISIPVDPANNKVNPNRASGEKGQKIDFNPAPAKGRERVEKNNKIIEDANRENEKAANVIKNLKNAVTSRFEKKDDYENRGEGSEKLAGLEKKIRDIEAKIAAYVQKTGTNAEPKIVQAFQREINILITQMVEVSKNYDITIPKSFVAKYFNITPKATTPEAKKVSKENNTKKAHLEDRLARASELNLSQVEIRNIQTKLGMDPLRLGSPATPKVKRNPAAPGTKVLKQKTISRSPLLREQPPVQPAAPTVPNAPAAPTQNPQQNLNNTPGQPVSNPSAPGAPTGLPRNPGTLPATPDVNPTQKAQEDYAKFLEKCEDRGTGGLVRQLEATMPEFANLSEGKKMMVIAGMNQEILKHVNQKAQLDFQEKASKVNGLGRTFSMTNRFGRLANVLGNMPTLLRKNFLIAESRKKELAALHGDSHETEGIRNGFLSEKIPALVQVYGKYNIDAFLGKDGKTPVVDFANLKGLQNAPVETQTSGKKYTELANELAYTPKGNSKYKKLELELAVAREDFLLNLEAHARASGIPDPEAYTHQYLGDSENLMKAMNLAAADPQTAQVLSNIKNNSAYTQGLKDLLTERGLVIVGGAGARLGARAGLALAVGGTIATVTGPASGVLILGTMAIAGGVSYVTGRVRASKTLEQQKEMARNGMRQKTGVSKKAQRYLDQLQVAEGKLNNPANSAVENEVLISEIKSLNNAIAKERQNGLSSTGFSAVEKNLKRLSDEKIEAILNETSPMKKQVMLLDLKTSTEFVMAKLERQEINFGKGPDVFVNQDKLVTALQKAQAAIQVNLNEAKLYEMFNAGADANISEMAQNVLAKRSHLKEYGGLRAERIKNEEAAWRHTQASKSAFYGALLAGSTVTLRELAPHVGWPVHNVEHVQGSTASAAPSLVSNGSGELHAQHIFPPVDPSLKGFQPKSPFDHGIKGEDYDDVRKTVTHTGPKHVGHGGTHHAPKHPAYIKPIEDQNFDENENIVDENIVKENPIIDHSHDVVPAPAPKGPAFDHIPSYDEISKYRFTDGDRFVIKQMADSRWMADMQKFFPNGKHGGLLDRNVNRFINRNEGGIWSGDKRDLHKFFTAYEEETNDTAKPGETTEDYIRHIEEYYAEKDFLQGKGIPKANPNDVYVSFKDKNAYTTEPVNQPESVAPVAPRPAPIQMTRIEPQQPHFETTVPEMPRAPLAKIPHFEPRQPSIETPSTEYAFDNSPEGWYKNAVKLYMGGEDSRVWKRIHGLSANNFFDRSEGGFMGKDARMYRQWLQDQSRFFHVKVDDNMTVEDLSKVIAEHRVFSKTSLPVKNVAETNLNVPKAPIIEKIPTPAPEIKSEITDNAAAWSTKSWGEYFNGRLRPWSKVKDMNAQEFLKDESVRRKFSDLHDDLRVIVSQEHVAVDENMTVGDLMQKLGGLNKDGTLLHEWARPNGSITSSSLELDSINHDLTPRELAWTNMPSDGAGQTNGLELLSSYEFMKAVDSNMEKMINKIMDVGTDGTFWEKTKNMTVENFLDSEPDLANPSHELLFETLEKMERIDPDLASGNISVERFMRSVYNRDEYVKMVRESAK